MFDIGFSELLMVALVALVVLGPERLPGAARMAGLWIGRLKRSFNSIKTEVEREIGVDEIRRQLTNEQILSMELEAEKKLSKKLELLNELNAIGTRTEDTPTPSIATASPAPGPMSANLIADPSAVTAPNIHDLQKVQ
ncbi:Sec-independent protein translocase protein TatB [Pseudomonas aeruginosa]|uniref:Sec-independent protein translocase protein TatB n=1 Tax=Pseudomonas aeruginosa TaxID=287 RepID=UPI000EAD1AF1|nr:Sec-independent protein translocase protein TatB [Pseudomonas aeruginosa]NNB83822.1 Sec-independent protein translocase subunit TatB [Pseudomonas aeruginosa]